MALQCACAEHHDTAILLNLVACPPQREKGNLWLVRPRMGSSVMFVLFNPCLLSAFGKPR
jgi:uncharacterized protein YbaR (Trm112 family)